MSSRPVRGNHLILGTERERHRKSPIDVSGSGSLSSGTGHRKSPTHHLKRASPGNSRTPSPGIDTLRTTTVRGRGSTAGSGETSHHSGIGGYHHTSIVKSPRSAFTTPGSTSSSGNTEKKSSLNPQKRRSSPTETGTNRKVGVRRSSIDKKRSSTNSPQTIETKSETTKRRDAIAEETDDGPDAELESIASGISQNLTQKSRSTSKLWQPPKSQRIPRPRSEPQHRAGPSSPAQKKSVTRRSSSHTLASSSGHQEEHHWAAPRNKKSATPKVVIDESIPDQEDNDHLTTLLQRILKQENKSADVVVSDIEELQVALEGMKQQVLSSGSSGGTKHKPSSTEEKKEHTSQKTEDPENTYENEVDPELARLHPLAEDTMPTDADEHVHETISQETQKESASNNMTRTERLSRIYPAGAKAPTVQMFNSAYDSAQRILNTGVPNTKALFDPRLRQSVGTTRSGQTRPPGDFYDLDRCSEIHERSRQREQEYLRENAYIQSIRSTISSPETVISSVSDYSTWSCPSPKSPSHFDASYQRPPVFVPRLPLETLHSPRPERQQSGLDALNHHSPDPNKSLSTVYSLVSAFTPRSSTGSDANSATFYKGGHRSHTTIREEDIKDLFAPKQKPAPSSSNSSTSGAATVPLPTSASTNNNTGFSATSPSSKHATVVAVGLIATNSVID